MWENYTNFFRISFIAIVAIFVIYFVYMNEKSKHGKSLETFVTNVEDNYRKSIVDTFHTVLGRDPYEFEVHLYRDYMKSPTDTKNIETKLMGSAEYKKGPRVDEPVQPTQTTTLDKTQNVITFLQTMDLDERLKVYRGIVKIYETNLFRMPTMKELNYYTYRLKTDSTFSTDKLTQILQMSKEYKILEKNQTNLVNADMEGNITDAEVTLIVNNAYKSVYNTEPTQEMEEFLKVKYIQYKMDNAKFLKLLKLLQSLDQNDIDMTALDASIEPQDKTNTDKDKGTKDTDKETKDTKDKETKDRKDKETKDKGTKDTNTKDKETKDTQTIEKESLPKNKASSFGANWNPKIDTAGKACTHSPYDEKKFFDMLYENIKFEQKTSVPCSSTTTERNRLAELQEKRNLDDQQYACSRNNYAVQVDEELMSGNINAYDKNILPQYRNTKYGAFLDDAANTKVGSILPRFVFKEYV